MSSVDPSVKYTLVLYANTDAVLIPGKVSLDDMNSLIGSRMVDCVYLPSGLDAWVDDEGLFAPVVSVNPILSIAAGRSLVGNAVITVVDDGGNTCAVDVDVLAKAFPGLMANVLPDVATAVKAAADKRLSSYPAVAVKAGLPALV